MSAFGGPLKNAKLRVLSLGAGVQSTTLALMAAHGDIGPMPDCAIFADTQSEPTAVYEHLAFLTRGNVLPFPVHVVSIGNLREEIMSATRGESKRGSHARPPFFVRNGDGSGGMIRRQCTRDFKIDPINKKVRDLIGLMPRQRWSRQPVVEQWVGISTDEASRMKMSRINAIEIRWPLIEKGMSRSDCLLWLERNGYPRPPKSACTFCPYHSNDAWRRLRDTDAAGWQDAVTLDAAIRKGLTSSGLTKGEMYLHRDRVPLGEVDLSTNLDRGQPDLFDNECEGMCGV